MIQYGYVCLRQYPKSERHNFGCRNEKGYVQTFGIDNLANKKYYKKNAIQIADVSLHALCYYIRLARDLQFLPTKKYENGQR